MTRQNRVDPSGRLFANPSKAGTLMGNRGCLHDGNEAVIRERAATKRWIACTLEHRFGKRKLMLPNSYIELFFLDEATALAAGHRPCAQCRGDAYKLFTKAWLTAGLSDTVSADVIDKTLDAERRATQRALVNPTSLADGAMVRFPGGGSFHLVHERKLVPWSFTGYGFPETLPAGATSLELVTRPSMLKVLAAGYVPRLHGSLTGTHADERQVGAGRTASTLFLR